MLRHLNIGIAVGYHRDLMHKSRQGFETATRQGRVRHTLDLDPVRAPVVRRIFDEYLYGTRGLTEIRDLLNSDPSGIPVSRAPAVRRLRLRMKGHRGTFPHYRCHITMQRAANIPPGHPATINVSERFLLQATLGFLARAVYGPDRLAYWQQVLAAAEQADPAAPARQRIREVEQAIADLRRRLRNQLFSLEDGDLKPEARRHITSRIAELEQAIADHQASLAKLHDELDLPVAAMDVVAPSLDRLPVFGERLWELSQRELRRLFDSLDLKITYDHRRRVGRVSITLASDPQRVRDSGPCPGRDSNARPTA